MAKIKKDLEQKIRRQAKERCGYCLNPQNLMPYKLEIEHLLAKALGGETVEDNLWLACRECNSHKAKKTKAVDPLTKKLVKLFNPHIETDFYVFVGERGRTHIFTAESLHHTSFRTTQKNRLECQFDGKWERIKWEDLPEELK